MSTGERGRNRGFFSSSTSAGRSTVPSTRAPKPSVLAGASIPHLRDITCFSGNTEAQEEMASSAGGASEATALIDKWRSTREYIRAMQAHIDRDYLAGVGSALKETNPKQLAYQVVEITKNRNSAWVRLLPPDGQQPEDEEGEQSLSKNLVQIEGLSKLALVSRDEGTGDGRKLEVSGHYAGSFLEGKRTGHLRPVAYVGSDMLRYKKAAHVLRDEATLPSGTRDLIRQVLCPSIQSTLVSHYAQPRGLDTSKIPANASQQQAVLGLRGGLEAIQGPPGTGKSTTIYHIINSRVLPGKKVLVTATRNQAINAVVEKLVQLDGGILVFGNPQRLCLEAREHTLKMRVARHSEVVWWSSIHSKLAGFYQEVQQAIKAGLQKAIPIAHGTAPGQRFVPRSSPLFKWQSAVRCMMKGALVLKATIKTKSGKKPNPLFYLSQSLLKWTQTQQLHVQLRILPSVEKKALNQILSNTRAFLSTIDAAASMETALEEAEFILHVDTVVIDEAACVPEYAVPQLLDLQPKNMVHLGDHKQLPCFSMIEESDLPRHSRSLMQRMVDCGVEVPMLCEQFRMAPQICDVVSSVFYGGQLTTAATVRQRHSGIGGTKQLKWVESQGNEEKHHKGGFFNAAETEQAVTQAISIYDELRNRKQVEKPSVFIMSLYNQQKYKMEKELQSHLGFRPDIEGNAIQVLSVDAVQGSEADATVLSLVKTQPNLSAFFVDPRRACVALSRAKHTSIIVGCSSVFVGKRCSTKKKAVWPAVTTLYKQA